MKMKWITTLPVAAALLVLPPITRAQEVVSDTPGIVAFTHGLDAHKLVAGAIVRVQLTNTVRFADGTKLPDGTWLSATVVQDSLQRGNVRLALRFTKAQLKSGKTIPIKAMILGVSSNDSASSDLVMPIPHSSKDAVDIEGVTSGVDLHSKVSSPDSGVFVSKTKDDVKLNTETEMELAITPAM